MAAPESGQKLLVGDDIRVVLHANGLAVVTDIAVTGIVSCAAGVTHRGADNSLDAPELGVRFPESAQGEVGCFQGAVGDDIY